MVCQRCSAEILESDKFCRECGAASPSTIALIERVSGTAPSKRRVSNALFFYDAPLWRDWLAYVTGLAVFVGARGAFEDYSLNLTGGLSSFSAVALLIDLGLAVAFQLLLFGVIPGAIRRAIRRRKTAEVSDRSFKPSAGQGIIQVSLLLLALPTLAAYGTVVANRPTANQAEMETCDAANRVLSAFTVLQGAGNRYDAQQALIDVVSAMDDLATQAAGSGNETLQSEAVGARDTMAASLEAYADGDSQGGASLSKRGDEQFNAVAAECQRLGQPLPPAP